MVDTFDELGRAGRHAKAKSDLKDNLGPATARLDAVKARERLRDAEAALRQLQEKLGTSPKGRIDFAMVRKIGAAENRVAEAREALRQIDPTSSTDDPT